MFIIYEIMILKKKKLKNLVKKFVKPSLHYKERNWKQQFSRKRKEKETRMKSQILLVMLIYAVSSVDAEVLGNVCDAKNNPAGHQIVGCEKIKTWSLERCPIFVQDQCNEKMPCWCKVTIYVTQCQEKWRCIWGNATTSTTTQSTTSSSTDAWISVLAG